MGGLHRGIFRSRIFWISSRDDTPPVAFIVLVEFGRLKVGNVHSFILQRSY